jgi:hypothetical protein
VRLLERSNHAHSVLLCLKVCAACANFSGETPRIPLRYIRATNGPVRGAHPTNTFVSFVRFVVKDCSLFGCGSAALGLGGEFPLELFGCDGAANPR